MDDRYCEALILATGIRLDLERKKRKFEVRIMSWPGGFTM